MGIPLEVPGADDCGAQGIAKALDRFAAEPFQCGDGVIAPIGENGLNVLGQRGLAEAIGGGQEFKLGVKLVVHEV
jgi:hypothetical protein